MASTPPGPAPKIFSSGLWQTLDEVDIDFIFGQEQDADARSGPTFPFPDALVFVIATRSNWLLILEGRAFPLTAH